MRRERGERACHHARGAMGTIDLPPRQPCARCPPCRRFTPVLSEKYKTLLADGKPFEVVFISSDRDDSSFNECECVV